MSGINNLGTTAAQLLQTKLDNEYYLHVNPGNISTENVRNLWRSVGWNWYEDNDGYERTAKALNNPHCTTWAVYSIKSNELVAIQHAFDNGFTAYLCYLVVKPNHQGKGIGSKLLDLADNKYSSYHREMLAVNDKVSLYREKGYGHNLEYTALAKWTYETNAPEKDTQSQYALPIEMST